MKLKFKKQQFQSDAVTALMDCFAGQPCSSGIQYRIDPGVAQVMKPQKLTSIDGDAGFKNNDIVLTNSQLLENIKRVQQRQNLPISSSLCEFKTIRKNKFVVDKAYTKKALAISPYHFDIEMETGTGKTYCYIKSMFEFHKRYGWSKFIVVVPSIAIREGVKKSFEITAEHFLEEYGKKARAFIYNSKQLHHLESFSSDSGINVMIINVQAFNARGADARRIYGTVKINLKGESELVGLDEFQSRKPIDVIRANRPILILDEPQKMEGKKTIESLAQFNPLMVIRYSATHKAEHNKIYRLDALDAYNQKLVKKIGVRGVSVKGLGGASAYLYVGSIDISPTKPPIARVEIEIRHASGIKRVLRRLGKGDNLYELSKYLDQYKGFVISDIDARANTVSFTNGVTLEAGDATGDVNEATLRRIQIREAIRAHFEKESRLFFKGIKVLTLFFIDEVAKYRVYDDTGAVPGEYAKMFEEEYERQKEEILTMFGDKYDSYLKSIETSKTHNGYFSIDKKTKQLVDPKFKLRGESKGESDDVNAYDLILKDKERLLSFEEPVRFIFSHSALREGWDNPNVFVICTLKHSDSTISRRQEVGRGMRLCVNKNGDRIDDPPVVHDVNVLTVVASESYKDFVSALQRDITESLSARPRVANEEYFKGKVLKTPDGDVKVTEQMAKQIYRYLLKNDYTDNNDKITQAYHDAKRDGRIAELPEELKQYREQILTLIDSVYSDALLPEIEDERAKKSNRLNSNYKRKEFQELWRKINHKAVYTVEFETEELIEKSIKALNKELRVGELKYIIERGAQKDSITYDEIRDGDGFEVRERAINTYNESIRSSIRYDLIGKVAELTTLTRQTVAQILAGIEAVVFNQFTKNPEDFIQQSSRIINEQKATVIIEHLVYDRLEDRYDTDIFTQAKPREDFSKALKVNKHIYDYVFTDADNERNFVKELDTSVEVAVYAKLPRAFSIPTPVGDYNPDWAIAFQEGKVKHVFFIAETKGSMSSLELRKAEEVKIDCARRFFAKITSAQVKYDVVDSYGKLMELVM